MGEPKDYKATLNLPRTTFPMKADLPKREPEQAADPGVELPELLVGGHVPEREHGLAMGHPNEGVRGGPRHPPGGGVGGQELGMLPLERLELPHEPVVLGVGEDGPVEDVVGVVGGPDLRPKALRQARIGRAHDAPT